MKEEHEPFSISKLIAKKIAGDVTDAEEAELHRWLSESAENQNIYNSIIDPDYKRNRDEFLQDVSIAGDWEKVKEKAFAGKNSRQIRFAWYRIAASIALLCAVSYGLFFITENETSVSSFEEQAMLIQPGHAQAIVKLHSGQTILLADSNNINKTFAETNGANILNTKGALSYEADATTTDELIYNEVVVPRGGEYKVVLADGTTVWLNSETRLKFPVKFGAHERAVELVGEAYFEVAHDRGRPFIVTTLHHGKVQVYGTSFNINSYEESNVVLVTLNEGKVSVRKAVEAETFLKPDEQAVLRKDAGNITVAKVDAAQFSAWRNGLLVFDNLSMEEICQLLSRWYNVNFEFKSEKVKQYRFTADIKRYGTFKDVLRFFEKTNQVQFEIDGKVIRVGEKKAG